MLSQNTNSQVLLSETQINLNTRLGAAAFALIFGSFLLFATAFSQPDALHNAAHDTRHAITAPCH